nr:MAG: putative binding domain protein [Bacteriophage sp.]
MAIPSNLSVTPFEGNGNTTISITSKTKPTGRNNVTSSITGKIVGQSNSVTINVTEKGKAEFVTFSGKDKTVHVGEDGETIEITGTSNSSKLTFSWSTNKIGIPNVTSFTVNNNTSATSGTAITGDPGATAQYTFKVSIVVPKNNTTDNRDSVLKVTCNTTSITDNFTISQMAGAAYLYLNSTGTTTASITIPQEGTSQTVNVLSNTNWTFE